MFDALKRLFRRQVPAPTYHSVVLEYKGVEVASFKEVLVKNAPEIKAAVHATKRKRRSVGANLIRFDRIVQRSHGRLARQLAAAWIDVVLKFQREINMVALESAIASGNANAVEAAIGPVRLQIRLEQAMTRALGGIVAASGQQANEVLSRHGITARFNAVHPNVVNFAREHAAEMVKGVARQTKQVIAEVIARGAEGRLTVGDQARAIREVVGLTKGGAKAVRNLAAEIRAGDVGSTLSRRLSAAWKQKIKSRIKHGTVTRTFVAEATEAYAASLVHLRALTIARTESLRAQHFGVHESWTQARFQGALPPNVKRYWIVTKDARLSPTHRTIPGLNPNGRRLDEPFITTEGPCMYPPSRPNCRCSVALGFGRQR